jgi:exodeoxyribonuclease V alpha subunit
MEEEQLYIVGEMKVIFFENASNFYKVMLVDVIESNLPQKKDEIVVTGSFGQVTEDTVYRFFGTVVEHPKYGVQFQATSYQQEKPTSKNGLISFLAGERFPGIGKRTAEKIVETFGEDAVDIILDDPDALKKITGMTPKKREMMRDVLMQTQGTEKILITLGNYGFSNNQAANIFNFYRTETLTVINENPFKLVEDIEGIGFKKADQLAEELDFPAEHKSRLKGGLYATLQELCLSNGDTYVDGTVLLERTIHLLEQSRRFIIQDDIIIEALMEMVMDMKVVEEHSRFAIPSLYFAEEGIASSIDRLLKKKSVIDYPGVNLDKEIEAMQKKLHIQYGASQIEAIKSALSSPFFILTGGPGTGKTTVLNGIVQLFSQLNDLPDDPMEYKDIFPILLAAPTGRAAKRMQETTGLPSSTIHRLLGLTGQEKDSDEIYTQELEGKLLIIDEVSMVDTWLMHRLLKSVPQGMQVLFVGDKDQLPSVGPGQVLFDLLNCKSLPQVELNEIFRQSGDSSIIPLAHEIKNGLLPQDFRKNQPDRSFLPCQTHQIEQVIRQVVEKAKQRGFTAKDIQVLAPMYKGPAGIDAINKMMQEIFNPNDDKKRREVVYFESTYRVGDKVLQLVNQSENNVFNGDMGEITAIQFAKETEDKVDQITILFDTVEVTYNRNNWNRFVLAYCCSIHKSQGSEFTMVILPMVKQYGRMLRRNLLYTAITRSKSKLILCGDYAAFEMAVESSGDIRKTLLHEKLERNLKSEKIFVSDEGETAIKKVETVPALAAEAAAVEKFRPEKQAPSVVQNNLVKEEKNVTQTIYHLTMEQIIRGEVDPMIGMENITPEMFMAK